MKSELKAHYDKIGWQDLGCYTFVQKSLKYKKHFKLENIILKYYNKVILQ